MATNKNAQIRYKILDKCFRNTGKRYFINDLIDECDKIILEIDPKSNGISRRQILYDIRFMESSEGWNIELDRLVDGKMVYYRYKDTNYSIYNMPLNELEIIQLKTAFQILTQFKGIQQLEWVNELLFKLNNNNEVDYNHAIIEFDSNNYLKGIEYFGIIYNAILYKKALTIKYKSFISEEINSHIFHPYYLKQYNNRWFIFGHATNSEFPIINLALDRIVSIKESKKNFIENNSIKWDEYFEDIVGVTKPMNGNVEEIVLHIYANTINYIKTKPLHGSQNKIKIIDNNTAEVKLKLIINYEFESLLMSFGNFIKVIKPIHLANKLKERYKLSFNLYV